MEYTESAWSFLFGELHDDAVAGGEGWGQLPGLHQQGEVPGDDLSADADRLVPRVAEVGPVDGDRLAVVLVRPPCVVAVTLDGEVDVRGHGHTDRLAGIQGLQGLQNCEVYQTGDAIIYLREFLVSLAHRDVVGVPLHEVGELVEEPAPVRGVHLSPLGPEAEGMVGSLHGGIHVSLVALLDVADDLLRRRIHRGKRLARCRFPELVVDEHLFEQRYVYIPNVTSLQPGDVFAHPSALDIRVLGGLLEGRGSGGRHAPDAEGGVGRPGSGRRDGTQHLPELDISPGKKDG